MDQATQVTQAALQAPINNLVILVAVIALLIIVGVGFLIYKFAPIILKQIQQQIETNAKLTTIVGQNAEQAQLNQEALSKNNDELVKQTTSIDKLVNVTTLQGIDFKAYQTLVSDNMSHHTNQIEANTASIAGLKASIETLSQQITEIVSDKVACAGMVATVTNLKNEIMAIIQAEQIRKATGTHPTVNGESTP